MQYLVLYPNQHVERMFIDDDDHIDSCFGRFCNQIMIWQSWRERCLALKGNCSDAPLDQRLIVAKNKKLKYINFKIS